MVAFFPHPYQYVFAAPQMDPFLAMPVKNLISFQVGLALCMTILTDIPSLYRFRRVCMLLS